MFWRLTPYQTRIAMKALQRQRLATAWHVAALSRQTKLLPLDSLLRDPEEPRDMLDMKEALRGFGRTRTEK